MSIYGNSLMQLSKKVVTIGECSGAAVSRENGLAKEEAEESLSRRV